MHILYAEDHPADADLLQSYLVKIVDSGAACLEQLALASFDVVLLDNHLPDMDGIELLRQVRATDQALPVVMTPIFGLRPPEVM